VYRAPYDVRVDSTYVAEGSRVRRRQPLLLLASETVANVLAQATADYEGMAAEHRTVVTQIANATERVHALRRQLAAAGQRFTVVASDTRDGESFQASQLRLAEERLVLARGDHDRTVLLLERGVVTRPEYEQARRRLLDAQGAADQARRLLTAQRATRTRLDPDQQAEVARLQADALTTDAARLSLIEREQGIVRSIEKQRGVVELRRQIAARRRVVAEADGTVRFLFNTKATSDFIRAGDALVEVAPPDDRTVRVYAKLQPSQAVVRRLRRGQRANIRLDSYHYYRYGPIAGRVRYVSPPDDSSAYYVLVDLGPHRKFEVRPGYTVRAEIVVARMKLYEFIARKLLGRLDG
jgi:membrane fusion protein (multidrug efflux system)